MASRMVTSEPRRFHTEPSSRPITPAPMTARRFGTASKVERTDVVADDLVVDRDARQVARLGTGGDDDLGGFDEFSPLTSTLPALPASSSRLTNLPCPGSRVTLFFLNRPLMPPVSCLTMPVLAADHLGRHRSSASPTPIPWPRQKRVRLPRRGARYAAKPSTECNRRSGRCRPGAASPLASA
jgi:hypothetical protein